MRIDGYRDRGKKIIKVSICIPGLDYSVSADYNNFVAGLMELEESVLTMNIAMKDLKEQVYS